MRVSPAIRDVLVLTAAAAFGWWAHGLHTSPVLAQRSGAGEDGLSFQIGGLREDTALTVWSPANRNLYIYAGALAGNSNVNCTYSLHIERMGAPIQRQNCPIGSVFPPR